MANKKVSSEVDVLRTLEKLENKHERTLEKKSKQVQKEIEITELEEKVTELKKRKMQLKEKLKRNMYQKLDEFVTNMEDLEYINTISNQDKKEILAIVHEIRCAKLKNMCATYRLTGVSIESDSPSKVNFRLDTFSQGHYWNPYYVEIQSRDQLKITRHTIPYFIPTSDIEQTYLNTDIQLFFKKLLKYLNAYTSRKEQVNQMQTLYSHLLNGSISTSSPFDYIEFTLQIPKYKNTYIGVKLSYESLTDEFPKKVNWDIQGNDEEDLHEDTIPKLGSFKFVTIASTMKSIVN